MPRIFPRSLLGLSSTIEIITGLLLILAPGLLCRLLLGFEPAGDATLLARLFGVALLCLGLACRPGGDPVAARSAPARALLLYNALIALFLTGVGLGLGPAPGGGVLLWPAVALHAAIAVLLVVRR